VLVTQLAAFCCAVAGYFCWVTLGFSMALTNVPLSMPWLASFSIAKPFAAGLVVLGVFTFSRQRLALNPTRFLGSVTLALAVGLIWSNSAHNYFIQGRVQAPLTLELQGVIVGLPESKGDKVTFLFRTQGAANGIDGFQGVLLRVTWRDSKKVLKPGQIWHLPLRLRSSDSVNVSGVAYVQEGMGDPSQLGVERTYHSIRFQLKQRLLQTVGKHNSNKQNLSKHNSRKQKTEENVTSLQSTQLAALLLALLLGDRSLLTPADWQLLSDTGTTHLMAISGLHIGLVASFTYLLVLYGLRLFRVNNVMPVVISGFHLAHLAALCAAWTYGALAGYSVPTQRACLTVTVVVILRLVYPIVNPWLAVLVSAAVVLLFDPIAILSASFWLTFTAVVFIFFVVRGRVGRLPVLPSWTRVQLALFIGLLPLSVGYFGKVSLVSIFANLVAVPVVGWLVVPIAFFYAALICCGVYLETITHWVIVLLDTVVAGLMFFLVEVQSWGAVLLFPQPSNTVIWFAMLGAAVLCLPRAVPGKRVALLMFMPLFASLLVLGGRGNLTGDFVIDALPSNSTLMVIDRGDSLVLIGLHDTPAYKIQYQFSRYLQRKGVKNELSEPVFSTYRQWISEEYFVLNVRLQSRPFLQWAAVDVESLSVCAGEVVEFEAVTIESMNVGGRCQLLLSGERRHYLVAAPGSVQQQLTFVDRHKSRLVNKDITGLLVNAGSGQRGRTDVLLSGALLNTVNPTQVVFLGKAKSAARSKNSSENKIDVELSRRLAAREIEVKKANSQGMLLKL